MRYYIAEVDGVECLIREESLVTPPIPAPPRPGDIGLPAQLNTGRRSEFVVARDVFAFELQYLWPAPPPRGQRVPPNVPPPPARILATDRIDFVLPQAISIRLLVRDDGNLAGNGQTRFEQTITFPTTTSPAPESLVRGSGF